MDGDFEKIKLNDSEEFEHSIIVSKQNNVDSRFNLESDLNFKNKSLTETQQAVANCVLNNRNVLYAAPSSTGKTFLALWAAYRAIKQNQRFAFVVLNENCQNLLMNEFKRFDCEQVCVVKDLEETIDPTLNLIITASLLCKLIKTDPDAVESIGFFIFDNIDCLQDKENGYVWEEALIRLPKTSRCLLTSSVFNNIEVFIHWLVTIFRSTWDLIKAKKLPFEFDFNVAVPIDFNNMNIFNLLSHERQFELEEMKFDETEKKNKKVFKEEFKEKFEKAIDRVFTPKNNIEVVEFAKACNSTFPIRRTIRELYRDKSWPIIVVTFDEYQAKLYAWQTGTRMGMIGPAKKLAITKLLQECKNCVLDQEDDAFLLLDQLKEIFLNGVAYLNSSMPAKIRELVEALFRRELLKVLVVTEEIAINSFFRGKMVIISSCRKFDGISYRYLTNYEFQRLLCLTHEQASKGHFAKITLILDWKMSIEALKSIVGSQEHYLHSFITRCPNPQRLAAIIPSSFHRFLERIEKKERRKRNNELVTELEELRNPTFERQIKDYLLLQTECEELAQRIENLSFGSAENIGKYLNCGRLVKIVNGERDFGIGIVIDYTFKEPNEHNLYIALRISRDSQHNIYDFSLLTPAHPDEINVPYTTSDRLPIALVEIVKVPIRFIKCVYIQRVRLPEDLRDQKNYDFLKVLLNGVLNGYALEKLVIGGRELNELRHELKLLEQKRDLNTPLAKRPDFGDMLKEYNKIESRRKEIEENQKFIDNYRSNPFVSN